MKPEAQIKTGKELGEFLPQLIKRFDPAAIICFGTVTENGSATGTFRPSESFQRTRYFLLVVTPENLRMEHEVQEFANNHFHEGAITAIAHGRGTVEKAIREKHRFFISVYRDGLVLYETDHIITDYKGIFPSRDHDSVYTETRLIFDFHWELSEAFMQFAELCLEIDNRNACAFVLNQAAEQALLAIIYTFTGYRVDARNLGRLLDFCKCFTQGLSNFFPRLNSEEIRLFKLLQDSFSLARFGPDFEVLSNDIYSLMELFDGFLSEIEKLSRGKLEQLKINHELIKSEPAILAEPEVTISATETVTQLETPVVPDLLGNSASARRQIIDLLTAVVKPLKIYGLWEASKDWDDETAYLHLVIVADNRQRIPFKETEPLIAMARMGDELLTCSLYKVHQINKLLTQGHVFLSGVCIPERLIYDSGMVQLPDDADKLPELLAKAKTDLEKGLDKAKGFFQSAKYHIQSGSDRALPTFMLQQAAELAYRAVIVSLLGMKFYIDKTLIISMLCQSNFRRIPKSIPNVLDQFDAVSER